MSSDSLAWIVEENFIWNDIKVYEVAGLKFQKQLEAFGADRMKYELELYKKAMSDKHHRRKRRRRSPEEENDEESHSNSDADSEVFSRVDNVPDLIAYMKDSLGTCEFYQRHE